MAKIILNGSIDVKKIDKSRLYQGKKGTYLSVSIVLDPDQLDQYENNGFIAESVSKDEREAGTKGTILGNVKVAWKEQQNSGSNQQRDPAPQPLVDDDLGQDIPF